MFLGLRTIVYQMSDLDAGKAWFTKLLGTEPYFDEPFYVGFEVAGYELGLVPKDEAGDSESTTYWGVPDAAVAMARLIEAGATLHHEVTDVGDSIRVAAVREPNGNVVGVIENPQFALVDAGRPFDGPGR
jgi:predicted enzyme related to lactoylglutathione lyase